MAFVLADRVRELSTTTGTGAFALGGAPQGYQDFDTRLADGDTTWYTAILGSQWEMGLGTYDQDTNTLARTQIFQSSEGDAVVDFAAGSKAVFISVPSNFLDDLPKLTTIEENADVTDAANVGAAINGAAQKSTIVNADKMPLLDSEASNTLKWGTVSNFQTNLDVRYYSKSEVDALLAAQAASMYKYATVRVATTANITIATALNNGDSLDGVTLATGDYVLVKNQSTASQNGVYVVGTAPARAPEFNTYNELVGSRIGVQEGTTNADTAWLCTSNSGGTIDVTNVVFTKMNISGELLAANNLSDLTDVAAARTILNVEDGADVTDEANVRAALAALTASVIQNRSTVYRVGTADTQTIMQTFAWSPGIARWGVVIEADAGWALYAYDAAGVVIGRPFYISQSGDAGAIFTGSVTTDHIALRDASGAGPQLASFFCGTDLTSNRSYTFNMPDSAQTYTWPAQNGTIMLAGKQSIPIAAAGCISPTSGGAADGVISLTNQTYAVKDFDASTAEAIFFDIRMPRQWDEGTITFDYGWLHGAAATFGVVFGLSAVAISNDDGGDAAFGTEVIVVDTGGTTNDYYISNESSAITIGGSPQAGDLVRFKLRRVPTDGSDTLNVDARLNDINIYINTVSGNDA